MAKAWKTIKRKSWKAKQSAFGSIFSSDSYDDWLENGTMIPSESVKTENDKKIKTIGDGKVLVVYSKNSHKLKVPLFCPLCDFPMKTQEDASSYKNKGCCDKCDVYWRSDKSFELGIKKFKELICTTDKWSEYYEHRNSLSKAIINIK